MAFPAALLPAAPSWYPGHMNAFVKRLPVLLSQTDIILELRDTRMPLTSINPAFESRVHRWRADRKMKLGSCCERIIVYGKRDLVSPWGLEPFHKAMQARHPEEKFVFTAKTDPRALKSLHNALVNLARTYAHSHTELNVLIMGMPNVGKSTLLNGLRTAGIPGASKALRTSALPGMTRALSTRLKLYDPVPGKHEVACPIYAFDTPGLMLPFLGSGSYGRERGVRLALIAALKEGMYDYDLLATYLVHRLNFLQPDSPAYLPLLVPRNSKEPPVTGSLDAEEFLDLLCARRGMVLKGGFPDYARAATWFVQWWRENGALVGDNTRRGWGFDFDWGDELGDVEAEMQARMEKRIIEHFAAIQEEDEVGERISKTHKLNVARAEVVKKRKEKQRERAIRLENPNTPIDT
ncbi:P-loop containing nucleoside triphosphate hydrolase protein [Exidia glandulosa HHB12029]|uniref:p-loop containing nucleoside triphosphate hydrolase protein n=1 Tax=Exidia glandulosa HHB12029 TaxID=1314781 RepID=A0A165K6R6_EXIGL|nr:P-loop containing nucleoside triphosphate hydrolase protein [Exidia glandulosa HHB12029]